MKKVTKILGFGALIGLAACATDPNEVQQLAPGCDAPAGQLPGSANSNPIQGAIEADCEKQSERQHGGK